MSFELIFADIETTGLDIDNSIIEISMMKQKSGDQMTWLVAADEDPKNISAQALKKNGHRLDDILCQSNYGKESYKPAEKIMVEIENWLGESDFPAEKRVIVAHNANFDHSRLLRMWSKCGQRTTFPLSDRLMLDTISIELFVCQVLGENNDYFNLAYLVDKYKVKKLKAHTAKDDVIMLKDVFNSQFAKISNLIKK